MSKFQREKEKTFDEILEVLDKAKRASFVHMMGNVAERTPVRKGTARANWVITADNPSEDYDPTLTKADQPKIEDPGTADVLWGSNNTPYILPLNDGHSKKAPAGFIDDAVDEYADLLAVHLEALL